MLMLIEKLQEATGDGGKEVAEVKSNKCKKSFASQSSRESIGETRKI